jgi:hypothetical protein
VALKISGGMLPGLRSWAHFDPFGRSGTSIGRGLQLEVGRLVEIDIPIFRKTDNEIDSIVLTIENIDNRRKKSSSRFFPTDASSSINSF